MWYAIVFVLGVIGGFALHKHVPFLKAEKDAALDKAVDGIQKL